VERGPRDRRWNISHGIRFQQPERLIADLRLDERTSPNEADRTIHTNPKDSKLNFIPSQRLLQSQVVTVDEAGRLLDDSAEETGSSEAGSEYDSDYQSAASQVDTSVLQDETDSAVSFESFEAEIVNSTVGNHVPIPFQISQDAKKAAREMLKPNEILYWTSNLYRGPDGQKVESIYCDTLEESEKVAKTFLDEQILGFDLEWNSFATDDVGVKENVSLLQLASPSRIALFHMARFQGATLDKLLVPSIQRIMESPNIIKTGVAISADCNRLTKYLGIKAQGLMELSHFYSVLFMAKPMRRLVRLALQVEKVIGLPLRKDENIRCSNWALKLNTDQIAYAGNDAYCAVHLFDLYEAKRAAVSPPLARPPFAELGLPLTAAEGKKKIRPSNMDTEGIMPKDTMIEGSKSRLTEIWQIPVSNDPNYPPELLKAESLVNNYIRLAIEKNRPCSVKPASLRGYFLWHKGGMDVPAIASLLRKPPLDLDIVVQYISSCIHQESLPFNKVRYDEVLTHRSKKAAAKLA
jgi:hypothetical protein